MNSRDIVEVSPPPPPAPRTDATATQVRITLSSGRRRVSERARRAMGVSTGLGCWINHAAERTLDWSEGTQMSGSKESDVRVGGEARIARRSSPSAAQLENRARLLARSKTEPLPTRAARHESPLETGNAKIGKESRFYSAVLVWNLPPVQTCPGASQWCTTYCYNGQDRPETYKFDRWRANLYRVLHEPEHLADEISEQLAPCNDSRPAAVRIHSSGDFFSVDYCSFWLEIVRRHPRVRFWAYTRSWVVDDMYGTLVALSRESNMQLLLSWDHTMRKAPPGWRMSYVLDPGASAPTPAVACPEETGRAESCATCRYCIEPRRKGVAFAPH